MSLFKNTLTNTNDKKYIIDHLLGYLNEEQKAEGQDEGMMHNLGYLSEEQFVDCAKQVKDKKFLLEALIDITKQFDARYETNFLEAINEATDERSYSCANCGGGFKHGEMVFGEDEDLCKECAK